MKIKNSYRVGDFLDTVKLLVLLFFLAFLFLYTMERISSFELENYISFINNNNHKAIMVILAGLWGVISGVEQLEYPGEPPRRPGYVQVILTEGERHDIENKIIIHEGQVSEGSHIKKVEQMLYNIGYSVHIDGIYDRDDVNTVIKFQKKHGIGVDGKVGPETLEKLENVQ